MEGFGDDDNRTKSLGVGQTMYPHKIYTKIRKWIRQRGINQ